MRKSKTFLPKSLMSKYPLLWFSTVFKVLAWAIIQETQINKTLLEIYFKRQYPMHKVSKMSYGKSVTYDIYSDT